MADELTLPERPALEIELGGQTIKMTYGLEMDLRRMLPNPEACVALMMTDTFTQDYVIRRILTPKRKMIIDPKELISDEQIELTSDEIEAAIKWAAEHALYFFTKRTLDMSQLGVQYAKALPMPSTAGSETSPSTTPSAGHSES